ncbi:unnamed protein product [Calicophoron daubneyi]|uniref:Peptidase M28 domain-containing protein n=1 Tax=Calicophoron daubneyi TaxID=300641 RepID=A0AAV2T562_CALDB
MFGPTEARSRGRSEPLEPSATRDQYEAFDSHQASTIGSKTWLVFFALILTVSTIVINRSNQCPTRRDGDKMDDDSFDPARARELLRRGTLLRSRMAGTFANENETLNIIRKQLLDIASLANNSGLQAFVDEQTSSASSFRFRYHVSSYQNLKNLVLKIHDPRAGNDIKRSKAFLVNCHYDSVVSSPGASDNYVNCAIMLEVSRILASGKLLFQNDAIFLFNGAEECGLMASHAFVTGHRWARDVAAFLNLEGAGAGGRLALFQTGPGKASETFLQAYSKAFRYPYGNVVAEDLFHSGIIPSDTDFRIFRDYGQTPGIDMAYIYDGYAYHTAFDTESRISQECLRNTGQDVLSFVRVMLTDNRLSELDKLVAAPVDPSSVDNSTHLIPSTAVTKKLLPKSKVVVSSADRYVFFDVFGAYFVVVRWRVWKILDYIVLLFTFVWVGHERKFAPGRWFGIGVAFVLVVISQVGGFCFAYLVGLSNHMFGVRMSWYSARYNLIGSILVPFAWWFVFFFGVFCSIPDGWIFRLPRLSKLISANWVVKSKVNYHAVERDFYDASLLMFSALMMAIHSLDIPSVFILTVWLVTSLAGRITYERLFSMRLKSHLLRMSFKILLSYTLWYIYFVYMTINFFIPVMGRSGQMTRPDLFLSLILFGILVPLTSVCASEIQCTSVTVRQNLHRILLGTAILHTVLVNFTPYGFPYMTSPGSHLLDPTVSPRYQRLLVFHVQRSLREIPNVDTVTRSDSFLLLSPGDVNGIRYLYPSSSDKLKTDSSSFGTAGQLHARTARYNVSLPYCGIGYFYPFLHLFSEHYVIPAKTHHLKPGIQLTLIARSRPYPNHARSGREIWNFTFSIASGPPEIHILIRTDVPTVCLTNWSVNFDTPHPVPVPLSKVINTGGSRQVGAHYYVHHINAAAVGEMGDKWAKPWIFWLVVDFIPNQGSDYFDVVVGGNYVDETLPSSSSADLKKFISRLPPWIAEVSGSTSYQHYRFSLL